MNIIPFQAVRPTRDKASLVTCRPYEDYGAAELASQLDFNPYSFLHVLHPGFINVQRDGMQKRFGLVKAKFADFKHEHILKQETETVFYLYELKTKYRSYTGIIAGLSLEEYRNDKIKKHEDTLEYRVEQFKEYLNIAGFNTEPVLVAYPENAELETWIENKKHTRPLYHFSTPNRDRHTLWRIKNTDEIRQIRNTFDRIPALYIADGHHRCASAEKQASESGKNAENDFFMSFVVSENQIKINEYNRVIRDLNGHTPQELLKLIEQHFECENRHHELWKPTQKGEFGMYLNGDFYLLRTRENIQNIDAELLYNRVLAPLLGIGDLRTDGRIEYLPGTLPLTRMMELVDSEEFEIGFTLFPVSFSEIKQLADNHKIMPPKSTYIEPKFRSGLVIHEL